MSVVCSCRAPHTVERIKRDSIYIDRLKRDSIYQRDSIYIIAKGDTVFKYQYKYSYRDKLVRDTMLLLLGQRYNFESKSQQHLTFWNDSCGCCC